MAEPVDVAANTAPWNLSLTPVGRSASATFPALSPSLKLTWPKKRRIPLPLLVLKFLLLATELRFWLDAIHERLLPVNQLVLH